MVETKTGTDRSAGVSYNDLLDQDSHPVPDILRQDSPMPPGPTRVDARMYHAREYHDLEVERLWKRVWQLACHEDDIPEVGDSLVYDIASLSFIVVRTGADEFKAYPNACLHRGRALLHEDEKGLKELRCPFHGWAWELSGALKEVPCHWDFPTVTEEDYSLKEVQVGRWGGFVFINPDPAASPLEDHIGNLDDQFPHIPFSRRYKAAHVAKRLNCNWKLAQEAFMESYHVVATHPTLLYSLGDANSKYDVFGNYSRAMSPQATYSPHVNPNMVEDKYAGRTNYAHQRHELTGAIYDRLEEGRVKVTLKDGRTGVYDDRGHYLEGERFHADIHLCNWVGGRLPDGTEDEPVVQGQGTDAENRAAIAKVRREGMRQILGDLVDEVSDAEFIDPIFYSVFPNISPWGTFNPIFYRFRPDGDNPEQCIHETFYMVPAPAGEARPPAAPMHFLDLDDDYLDAPELGMLSKVFNQDTLNLPYVQKGVKQLDEVIFANYGETKLRHFHKLLAEWLAD